MSAERSPEVLISPDNLDPGLRNDISGAAIAAYSELAGPNFLTEPTHFLGDPDSPLEMVWQTGYCHHWAAKAARALRQHNAQVTTRAADKSRQHAYIVFPGMNLVADGEWQNLARWQEEFNGPGTAPLGLPPDAPLVLVGTRESVKQQAAAYGLTDQRIQSLWNETGPRPRPGPVF